MKKIVFLFVVGILALTSDAAFAQYNKGDVLLNAGIGVNSYYNGGIPLTLSLEVGVTKEISIGGYLDYVSYNYNVGGNKYGFYSTFFGGRGSFHFSELLDLNTPELDLYGGAAIGVRTFTWRDSNFNNNYYGSGLYVGIFAGARYYLSKGVGLFGEVGAGGSSNARLGLAVKF